MENANLIVGILVPAALRATYVHVEIPQPIIKQPDDFQLLLGSDLICLVNHAHVVSRGERMTRLSAVPVLKHPEHFPVGPLQVLIEILATCRRRERRLSSFLLQQRLHREEEVSIERDSS